MTTSFQKDLARGKEVEEMIDRYFVSQGVVVKNVSVEEEIQFGYDRMFWYNGAVVTVEYKSDFASERYGNFYLESEIVDANGNHKKDGWLLHSQADRLMILGGQNQNKGLYIISHDNLVKGIDIFRTYPLRKSIISDSGNATWRALGFTVPCDVFAQYCHKFIPYSEFN